MVTTTIDLPDETHATLRGIAEREGRRPDQVIRELIEERVARESATRPQPAEETVGTGGDAEAESTDDDVWGDEDPPWAGLIGMFPDGGVKATEFDEWLAAARASDERLARKTSLKG